MKRGEASKLIGIIDILINNALKADATKIHLDLEDLGESYRISIEDNGGGLDESKLGSINQYLNRPRNYEMEEFYSGLVSKDLTETGLQLVSIMVDEGEVKTKPGSGTKIVLTRNKR